ncbi:hypothetical protein AB0I84_36565, partial [Streptomyces spectabilis]
MTLSADGRPSGIAGTPRAASSLPLLLLGAAAVAGAAAAGLAPSAARGWVAAVAVVGWLLLAVVVWTGRAGAARLRAHAAQLEIVPWSPTEARARLRQLSLLSVKLC